jgi:hypothetical protein
MKPLKLIFISVLLTSQFCFGQSYDINLTDSTIFKTLASLTGHFIIQNPLKNGYSLSIDTMELKEEYTDKEFAELKIKFPFLKESLEMDEKTIDTSKWTHQNFPDKILVDDYNTEIDYKELTMKYNLVPNKKLKDTIWRINNDNCFRRKIVTRISKPVFNTKKTLCAIDITQNDICGEGRTDKTFVFYKENGIWKLSDYVGRSTAVKY